MSGLSAMRACPSAVIGGNSSFYRFAPIGDRNDREDDRGAPRAERSGAVDLAYPVELWDSAKDSVERVLAIAASGSIGYAAYFEATKEYPDRYVTLRHKTRIMARWNPPLH